jgi:hypothetical protein
MSNAYTSQTRLAHVRRGFTEEDVWRDALGNAEPLRVFVTDGALDAPEHLPAGSMRSMKHGPYAESLLRPGWFA